MLQYNIAPKRLKCKSSFVFSSQFARLLPSFCGRRLAQFEVLAGRIGIVDLDRIFEIENALFPVAVLIPEEAVDAMFTHDAHPCIHQRQTRT